MKLKSILKASAIAVIAAFALSCNNATEKPQEEEISPKEELVEKELKNILSRNNAVGLSVAAVKDGEIVYVKSLGYKNLEKRIALEDNDILRIASISKSFTATGIMQLVEQGKLSLDADVSDLVGFTVRNPNYPDTPVTVRMLLSHTSSMSDANGYFSINKVNPDSSSTWKKAWSNYEPGSGYQYCNLGYNTLGTILERVSGERFDKYIVNHILKPLGVYGGYDVSTLDPTRFIQIYKYDKSNNGYTCSYDAYDPQEEEIKNYIMGHSAPIFSPTGGLKISATDLAKVMMMHMNQGTLNGVKIIDSSSAALMQSRITPTENENEYYGMAMINSDYLIKGKMMVGHDGIALGAYTAMYWSPEENFGLVIFTNGCEYKHDRVLANILCEAAECVYENILK
ncbi:MAG: beta-lactamase family protein [Bacteroidales bacterium]|nr:beta-lactamase family protein [Bacteroidales bacterium]